MDKLQQSLTTFAFLCSLPRFAALQKQQVPNKTDLPEGTAVLFSSRVVSEGPEWMARYCPYPLISDLGLVISQRGALLPLTEQVEFTPHKMSQHDAHAKSAKNKKKSYCEGKLFHKGGLDQEKQNHI